MISHLDETLRELLKRELPIRNSEVDVKFDQPKRDWSARVSRPTLNLFLHDIRENSILRQPEWEFERSNDGTVTKRRSPVRLDLHYMITAWVADHPEDEHRLLSRTLMKLGANPEVPYPDISTKAKAQQFIGLPMEKLETDKLDFLRQIVPLWDQQAAEREALWGVKGTGMYYSYH